MYRFIACSHRLGKLRVVSPYSGEERILTATGTWEKEENAEAWVDDMYPIYCNATKKIEQRKAVFYAKPTIDQERMKPKE